MGVGEETIVREEGSATVLRFVLIFEHEIRCGGMFHLRKLQVGPSDRGFRHVLRERRD